MARARKQDHSKVPKPPVSDIYDISEEALSQFKTWLEQSGLKIPASQLVGSASVPATPTAQNIVDALMALGILQQDP